MNINIIFFTSFFFFFSCDQIQVEDTNKTSKVKREEIVNNNSLPNYSVNQFVGIWIPRKYVDDLKKTKSPAKSYRFIEDISTIIFKEEEENVAIIYGNHEGTSSFLNFNNGMYSLRLSSNGEEKDCPIHISSEGSLIMNVDNSKIEFIKISQDGINNPIGYLTNNILFGHKKYKLQSSSGVLLFDSIIFTPNGSVFNFYNYLFYKVETDFTVYESFEDLIFFYKKENSMEDGDMEAYLFKIQGEVIELYEIFEDSSSLKYELYINGSVPR